MQNSMFLANLFSSNQQSCIDKSKSITPGQNSTLNGAGSKGDDTFSRLFASRINNSNNANPVDNNAKNSHKPNQSDKAHTSDRPAWASTKSETAMADSKAPKQIEMTDAEAYEMQKQFEELEKEAKDALTYICSVLGINVENVSEALKSLLADQKLALGENGEFLNKAEEAGVKNVLLLKMENIVNLLNKMSDFISNSNNADIDKMITEMLTNQEITEKQNDLKGIKNVMPEKIVNAADFEKIIKIIKEASQSESIFAHMMSDNGSDKKTDVEINPDKFNLEDMPSYDLGAKPVQMHDELTEEAKEPKHDPKVEQQKVAPEATQSAQAVESSDRNSNARQTTTESSNNISPLNIGEIAVNTEGDDSTSEKDTLQKDTQSMQASSSDKSSEKRASELTDSMQFKVERLKDDPPSDVRSNHDVSAQKISASDRGVNAASKNLGSFESLMNLKSNATASIADKFNVISQIMDKAKVFMKDGQNMMKIQLKPEHLGEVFMKVSIEEGRVTAKVVTESFTAKEAIETNLYQLKESLNLQGIKIDKFNVFVGDKWQDQSGKQQFAFNQGHGGRNSYRQKSDFEGLNPSSSAAPYSAVYPGIYDTAQINFVA